MNNDEQQIIQQAISILEKNLKKKGEGMTSPEAVKRFLRLHLELLEHEVFAVLFLDTQNHLIEFRQMFNGTIDAASVYPREVLKTALELNAAAVIFAHNHPSGVAEPSHADQRITERLKKALALVEIRVLDHFVVGHRELVSFSERGLL